MLGKDATWRKTACKQSARQESKSWFAFTTDCGEQDTLGQDLEDDLPVELGTAPYADELPATAEVTAGNDETGLDDGQLFTKVFAMSFETSIWLQLLNAINAFMFSPMQHTTSGESSNLTSGSRR